MLPFKITLKDLTHNEQQKQHIFLTILFSTYEIHSIKKKCHFIL